MRTSRRGARALGRRGAANAAALGLLAVVACQDPAADVTIAWIDAVDDADGNREMQVYDRGERFSVKIVPESPGSDADLIRFELDPRGDGILVAGQRATTYVSLRESRQPRLSQTGAGGRRLSTGFFTTRNSDGVVRRFETSTTGELSFMPTTGPQAGEVSVLVPPVPIANGVMTLSFASAAPVGLWLEQSGSPLRGWGRISAFAYPSNLLGESVLVDEVTPLVSGRIFVAVDSVVRTERHAPQWWCPGGVCMSSDGRSLTAMAEDRCSVSWWRWEDGINTPDVELEPTIVTLSDGCPADSRPAIFAQLEHDIVVLDDVERIYVGDLSTGVLTPGPKIWDSTPVLRIVDQGRALVLMSADSRVTRIDADGIRLLSTEAFPCFGPPADARVSPNGMWAVRTCNGEGSFLPLDQGAVVRISPLGVEVFPGSPMVPLGIDDLGNAVLFRRAEEGEPRGLFVLTSDGTVARVDPLEPEPALVSDGSLAPTYFATTPIRF